jgi:hypothetical protein
MKLNTGWCAMLLINRMKSGKMVLHINGKCYNYQMKTNQIILSKNIFLSFEIPPFYFHLNYATQAVPR